MTGLLSLFKHQSASSLRFRLLLLMGLASVIWVAVTALASYIEASHRIEQDLEQVFERELNIIEDSLEQRAAAATALSNSLYVVADAKAIFAGDSSNTLQQLMAQLPASLELSYMAAIETTGQIVAAVGASQRLENPVGENLFQYASAGRFQASESAFLEPRVDPFLAVENASDNARVITQWILVPVREDGRTYGWLLLSTRWQYATNLLLDKARASLNALGLDIAGVYVELIDGERVASSPPDIGVVDASDSYVRSKKLSPALQGLQLSMAIEKSLPRKRITSSVFYSLTFAGCTLLIMLVMFNWFFQRLVLDRLTKLKRAAEKMTTPEIVQQVDVVYDDELGALEETYNEMSRCLHQSYVTLEDTVAMRTQALLESMSQMERFNYIASHDLREPIRTVQTYCDMLRMDLPDISEDADADLRFIESATGRMGELVNDLLLYSRNRSKSISAECLSVQAVLDELCGDLGTMIKESGASVEYADLGEVFADREQLRHILQNLLTNGIKYRHADKKPEVKISSKIEGDFLQLSFADNGIGIDPAHHQTIFEPFKRLHTAAEYKGTGIGLAVVSESIRRHGGRISLQSAVGQGSVFSVCLPLTQAALEQAQNGIVDIQSLDKPSEITQAKAA